MRFRLQRLSNLANRPSGLGIRHAPLRATTSTPNVSPRQAKASSGGDGRALLASYQAVGLHVSNMAHHVHLLIASHDPARLVLACLQRWLTGRTGVEWRIYRLSADFPGGPGGVLRRVGSFVPS